ncbi:MAG: hypothetical protein ACLR8P_10830 [Clostridium fessum]
MKRASRISPSSCGYLKEKFEYLIDKFGVKLLYNPEYATNNNLATI